MHLSVISFVFNFVFSCIFLISIFCSGFNYFSGAIKILEKFAPIGGPEGGVKLLRHAFHCWQENLKVARVESEVRRFEIKTKGLQDEITHLNEELRRRDVFIGQLQDEIHSLQEKNAELTQHRERVWMENEEFRASTRNAMIKNIIAHVESVRRWEQEMAEDNYEWLRENFEEERVEHSKEVKMLEDVIEEAKRMGNDPYASARIRVVPRGEGVICTQCMTQVLTRKKQLIPTEQEHEPLSKTFVDAAKNELLQQEWADTIRKDSYTNQQVMISTKSKTF